MGLLPRIKTWATNEELTAADLNAEFDNILDNLAPGIINDYSANVSQMQTQTDPGEVGTESLATTLAGELARLRYIIKEITGEAYWYESPESSISAITDSLASVQPANRIVSGRVRSASSQAIHLVPNGAALSVTLKGASTNFIYVINDVQYTISTDVALTGLPAAPASNNTCLVNDAGISGSEDTKYLGEFGSALTVDAMGTEIVGLVGKYAGFKINNGSTDEYFIAYVESATKLTQVSRGSFFDSADAPIPRIAIADNDTITLMKAVWIFADTAGTLAATVIPPRVSKDEPTGPAANDYWYDLNAEIWKIYNGIAFVASNSILVGVALSDTTNTIAALSVDKYVAASATNTIQLEKISASVVRSVPRSDSISVFGSYIDYQSDVIRWDMSLDLDTGVTEGASTIYYFYITEVGETIISNLAPRDRTGDRLGLYHPFQTWRCVGQAYNDASSNLEAPLFYSDTREDNYALSTALSGNALTVFVHAPPNHIMKFKSATAASGYFESGTIPPGTSLTVSSGSTLGTTSAKSDDLYAHLILNAGRAELAIAKTLSGEGVLNSTTAEGGAGAADSADAMYSKVARSSAPVRPLGRLQNNQTTAGTWVAALQAIALFPFGAGGAFDVKTYTTVGANTWTKPTGLRKIIAISTGGGGGGGGADSSGTTTTGGGGGGAAGTSISFIPASQLGATETVTIGAAGTAGTNAGGTGGTGGTTTFGAFNSAVGGTGGIGQNNSASPANRSGGAGGTASNGNINIVGGTGHTGFINATGGNGGSSFFGGGARGGAPIPGAVEAGVTSTVYGAGGGGGACDANATGAAGGAGSAGICIVIEFYG